MLFLFLVCFELNFIKKDPVSGRKVKILVV
jgi:hypothetical protein